MKEMVHSGSVQAFQVGPKTCGFQYCQYQHEMSEQKHNIVLINSQNFSKSFCI